MFWFCFFGEGVEGGEGRGGSSLAKLKDSKLVAYSDRAREDDGKPPAESIQIDPNRVSHLI